eukprot:s7557_g2.t1
MTCHILPSFSQTILLHFAPAGRRPERGTYSEQICFARHRREHRSVPPKGTALSLRVLRSRSSLTLLSWGWTPSPDNPRCSGLECPRRRASSQGSCCLFQPSLWEPNAKDARQRGHCLSSAPSPDHCPQGHGRQWCVIRSRGEVDQKGCDNLRGIGGHPWGGLALGLHEESEGMEAAVVIPQPSRKSHWHGRDNGFLGGGVLWRGKVRRPMHDELPLSSFNFIARSSRRSVTSFQRLSRLTSPADVQVSELR